jgi:uncharacterized protein YuzE
MQANEAITKIKLLLGLNEATVEEQVVVEPKSDDEDRGGFKFETAKLVDGTEVKVEGEFEEGKACFVETEEGDIPAPAGVHQMADDKLITIDENGQIVAIEEVAAEEVVEQPEAEVEVEMEEEVKEEEEAMEEEVVEEEKISMAEEVVEALKPYFEEISDLKKKVEEMEGKFQAFSAEPAAKPIKKAENFEANKLSAVERIAKIRRSK